MLGDGAPRDQGAGGRWVKCKCNAFHSFVVAAAAPQHGRVGDGLGARAGPAHFSEGSDRQVKSREFPHHEEVTPQFAQG